MSVLPWICNIFIDNYVKSACDNGGMNIEYFCMQVMLAKSLNDLQQILDYYKTRNMDLNVSNTKAALMVEENKTPRANRCICNASMRLLKMKERTQIL